MIKDFDTAYMDFNLQRDYPSAAPDEMLEPSMPEQTMPGRQEGDVMLAAGLSPTVSDSAPPIRVGRAGVPFKGPSMSDITIPAKYMGAMLYGGFKGAVQGFVGLPGELEALAYGLKALASKDADESKLDAFLKGLEEKTIAPKTEEVKKWIDANVGTIKIDGNTTTPFETLGEIAAPGGYVKGTKAVSKGVVSTAKALAPEAGELVAKSMEKLGTPLQMNIVPLDKWSTVTANTAAKVDKGAVKLSNKVTKTPVLQLAPEYRVKVTGAYTPDGKTQNIPNAVNPGNYQEASVRLDGLVQSFPDPLESPERFSAMLATVYNSNEVPIPPRWMIENANDMPKWSNWFGQMTKGQLDEANRGFAVVDKFKQIYTDGTASPETTGRLMMWAMLSRRASAYPHESGFLDLAESMTPLIQKALRGEYGQADIDAGLQMIKQSIPSGSPGNMVTSNANDFLRTFLPKMSEKLPDKRTKLQALHDMIADPNMTGPQIRRAFYGLAQDVGIKNKVLSFALLVSGREDVMVLDRIQINRLFAGGEKIYDDVAHLFDGGPGLAIYEGLERSLGSRVNQLYANVGRADQAS